MSRLPRVLLATLTFAILAVATALPTMAEEVQLNTGGTTTIPSQSGSSESTDVPIANPGDAMYTARTFLLSPVCTGPCVPFSITTSFAGGGITATSNIALSVRQVPGSWASWSAPPFSETATPQVYFTQGATSLILTFNQHLHIGGFELEPNPFSVQTFTAQFFNGATLVETVTRAVDGQAGARLFAIDNPLGFDRIVVTGTSDFAIARLRGSNVVVDPPFVPEPATIVLLGTGLAGVAGAMRRRRKAKKD